MKKINNSVLWRVFAPWAILVAGSFAVLIPAHSQNSQVLPLAGSAHPVITHFLRSQTAGLPGTVSITLETPRSGPLPACETPEPFLPRGVRPWGRISVGVRCSADRPWTRYVPAYVAVRGVYYAAARPINAGQLLTSADAAEHEADLTTLPRSVVVDPSQFSGATAVNHIASGAPLRRESLRLPAAIQQGQNVKVSTQGTGFVVSAEGKAMSSAAVGARIQVKMQNGQLLNGLVSPNGTVERFN
jgi:flagella basal body P-ring formation protein FlgA